MLVSYFGIFLLLGLSPCFEMCLELYFNIRYIIDILTKMTSFPSASIRVLFLKYIYDLLLWTPQWEPLQYCSMMRKTEAHKCTHKSVQNQMYRMLRQRTKRVECWGREQREKRWVGRSQVLCLPTIEQQHIIKRLKSITSDPTVPGFKSQLCHLLAGWPCKVTYPFCVLVSSFVMDMVIVPAHSCCIKGITVYKVIGKNARHTISTT